MLSEGQGSIADTRTTLTPPGLPVQGAIYWNLEHLKTLNLSTEEGTDICSLCIILPAPTGWAGSECWGPGQLQT